MKPKQAGQCGIFSNRPTRSWLGCAFRGCATAACVLLCADRSVAADAKISVVENSVETAPKGTAAWTKAAVNQELSVGDRLRTGSRSRAEISISGLYALRLKELTKIELTPVLMEPSKAKLNLMQGVVFIFSREQEGEIDVKMPTANAGLRGTQLLARVFPDGKSQVLVLEGTVDLENPHGNVTLKAGEAGEAVHGKAPRKTPMIDAANILQWALYYPAVVDPADMGMKLGKHGALDASLAAYGRGNLQAAVTRLPPAAANNDGDRLFRASVLLAVGSTDEAAALVNRVPKTHPGRRAIERMLSAVRMKKAADWPLVGIATASEAMAECYYLQAWGDLKQARLAALRATELSPANGFAWTRLAELEFSAGRTKQAREAVEKALLHTPENARTHALRGFILSADNRIREAQAAFERSVRLDGAFGNGWLGLGLTKIKQGRLEEGRADLQTAATVEPASSVFHSYLGKAMSQDGRKEEAAKDLALAAKLDPADPTPPLYSAIEMQQNNRPNAAIGELDRSLRLNDNRRIYRSGFLLDQDRAVRGANLARIYQNAGMREVAVREAYRAVESDYTNPSAHLFLANAFDALRDPDRILLRHETPWFNELLMANLLSPVGGGPLSQFVSQQEYSKLLEADGIGGSLTSEWRSTSETRTSASIFGTHGSVSYGLDAYYRNDDGDRLNSDMELSELYAQLKWQASPDDTLYFLGKWAAQDNGDNFETYDNRPLAPAMRFSEDQRPGLLLGAWNHRWAPGSHTLVLAGRLAASQELTDPLSRQLLVQRDTTGMRPGFIRTNAFGDDEFTDPALRNAVPYPVTDGPGGAVVYSPALLSGIAPYLGSGNVENLYTQGFDFATRREWKIAIAEIQHIQQTADHTVLLGGRWQEGTIETDTRLAVHRPTFVGAFETPAAAQHVESDFQRMGIYAYDYWKLSPCLTLIGGVSWDRVEHPDNFRNPPVSEGQREEEDVSGKLGFTWTPSPWFNLRGAAAQGLGGLSFDESVRLEPSQIAGFGQAFRTLISESLVGSVEAPTYQLAGLAADGRLDERTWWGVSASMIEQETDRTLGVFTGYDSPAFGNNTPVYFPDGTPQRLEYREQTVSLTVNRLLGDEFAVGAGYRFGKSDLRTVFPELAGQPGSDFEDSAILHEVRLYGDWNSPTGFFAHLEANWFRQELDDDPRRGLSRPGDDFVQFNAWGGYRFASNRCEIRAGVLNIGGTDYHLSPLNPHQELTRDRTFFVLCRMGF